MTEGEEVKGTGNWMSGRRVEEATRGREEERTKRRTVRRMRVKGEGKAKEEERGLRKGQGSALGCGILLKGINIAEFEAIGVKSLLSKDEALDILQLGHAHTPTHTRA